MKIKSVIFIGLIFLFNTFSVFCGAEIDDDFSTPEDTIDIYHKTYDNKDILSECFHPQGFSGPLDKIWTSYKIIEKYKTTLAGKKTHTGIEISKDSVEIIVEVEMIDPNKANPKTKFWYLLQEINGKWKIIEHSHISDESYPAYD